MEYRPENRESRVELADQLVAKLTGIGFVRVEVFGTNEDVYSRVAEDGLDCRVFTTIENGCMRARAKDAIHVCLVYTGGDKPRGCGSTKSVHRVGVVEEVCDRVKSRVDGILEGVNRCYKCGTPTFKSKAKKDVCAALCWIVQEKKEESKPARKGLTGGARRYLAWLANPNGGKLRSDRAGTDQNASKKELAGFGLVEFREGKCCLTRRGRVSYQKAEAAGLLSA